jgi:hypothetical protein
LERGADRLLFCLNWERHAVEINVGVTLPEGAYVASVITLEQETPATVAGKSTFASSDLGTFRLALDAGQAKIVAISAAAKAAAFAP